MKIVVDTREQLPYWKKGVVRKKLDVGDYSIEGMEDKIAFERKSGIDALGTLGKGHKRFKKEIERSLNYDYFGIYIECTREQLIKKDFPGGYHSRMKGWVAVKILDTIQSKYGADVVFCGSRVGCKKAIKKKIQEYTTS